MFLENILLGVSIISISILLVYYLFFFLRLTKHKKRTSSFSSPISIIVCAKNEKINLQKNLPIILEQHYSKFEVIVVNDQSIDETSFLLEDFEKKYSNLVVVTIDEHVNHKVGKKFALTLGIKTAKYEYILLTDADCEPNSDNWIENMASNFESSDIVLGYGGYEKKNGLLNKLIRFDTFNIAQQYLSFALNGLAYMGVGRNLAYKKSIFFDNKGFASHIHIPSGDDDLFIQEVANINNISIEISKESHTVSEVIQNWFEWSYQKRRHLTTAPFYKMKFKLLLILYPYSQILFWASLLIMVILNIFPILCILLLVIKLILTYIINYKLMKRLDVIDLYWLHPIYELFFLIIQGFFVLLNLFSTPKKWIR